MTTRTGTVGPTARRRTGMVIGVLSLGVFMSSLDLFIVNLAFPAIAREYPGSGLGGLSWVLNAYTIVFAAVLVPAGRFADQFGRKRMFVAGLAVFALGSLLCGLAPGVDALVAARVLQAVGAGMLVPASLSSLLAAVPAARRARAIGTWSAAGAMGAALGPVIGGLLVEQSWRWVFFVNVPIGLVAIVLAGRSLAESRDPDASVRPDLVGAALLAVAVGALALALVKAPAWGWLSGPTVAVAAGSFGCLALVVRRSARHRAPVIELPLLALRSFAGSSAASVLYYAGFAAFLLSSVEFLTGVWHYSPLTAGLAIAPGPLMVLPFARIVAPRLGVRLGGAGRVAAIGCGVNALAQLWWLGAIQVTPAYVTHLLPAQLIGGAGVGLVIPSLIAAGSAELPAAHFGTGSGLLNMARQIGTVLGVAGLVALLATLDPSDPIPSFRRAIVLVVGFFVAAGLVAVATLSRSPATAASPPVAAPAGSAGRR